MISIIVPIYNVENYLEECLLSIQNQTYKDFECIMVNDGSTDNSPEIAQRFAESDARFRLIHQENKGLSGARNTGIKYVQGDLVSFVDSDDLLHHRALELAVKYIGDADILEGYSKILREYDVADIDTDISQIHERYYHELKEILQSLTVSKLSIGVHCKFYRRDLLEEMDFIEGKIHEDIPVTLSLYQKGYTVKKIDAPLYYYRKGHESITSGSFKERDLDIFYIIDIVEEEFKDNKEALPYLHQMFSGQLLYTYIMKMNPLIPESKLFTKTSKKYGKTAAKKSPVLRVALVSPTLAWLCARAVIWYRKVTKYQRKVLF